jgi:hypothetical protein
MVSIASISERNLFRLSVDGLSYTHAK